MASAAGMIGSCGAVSTSFPSSKGRPHKTRSASSGHHRAAAPGVRCSYRSTVSSPHSGGGALMDQYRTLRIQPGASESDVKKAFRRLALRYHPDVCKGSNSVVQFHRINEAYEMVMNSLRDYDDEEAAASAGGVVDDGDVYDADGDLWEDWMGFECACPTMNYTSYI